MKKQVLLLTAFLMLNLVSASIIIDNLSKTDYKIGDKINLAATITSNEKGQLFFSATLDCPSSDLTFYKTPIDQKENNYIKIPQLTINEQYVGNCKIILKIIDSEENSLEKKETETIKIKNSLELNFTTDKDSYKPRESIIIEGKSEKDAQLTITIQEGNNIIETINKTISLNQFTETISLPEDIGSGTKDIIIKAEDSYGNKAQSTKQITIEQIPKIIKIEVENKTYNPNENITISASVYDQSNTKMPVEIAYRIFDPNSNLIDSLTSSSSFLTSPEVPIPGEYIIKAAYQNLEDTNKFTINELKKINLTIDDGIIKVENIGNIRYVDNMKVNATIENQIYQVPISLDLKMSEIAFIDLKSELPSETYQLSITTENESYSLENIEIQDNRPVVKKLSQGLSRVTGSAIIETDEVSNVFYLGFTLVFLGFILIFTVNRRFKNKITQVVDETIVTQNKANKGLKQSLTKQQREKNLLREMFGSYVDDNILKKDFNTNIMKKDITVLFTDIRGFSKIFDKYDSEEISEMLNIYFSRSSQIIKRNNGFINKFIGDSVMALFNASSKDENHLFNTVKSAIEIKNEMAEVNKKLTARKMEPINVGYGIDSGPCAVGTVGSKEKLEFTAVGTPVNIASRLQAMSDGSILITERVYNKLKNRIQAKELGEFEMKNITGKVKAYKVLGIK